jgi:hypothetical protein
MVCPTLRTQSLKSLRRGEPSPFSASLNFCRRGSGEFGSEVGGDALPGTTRKSVLACDACFGAYVVDAA